MQGRLGAILITVAAALLLTAPTALAVDAWTPWTATPQDTWIRSLDFTAATTLVASSDGDGIFQSPATLGPWTQTNGGLTDPSDLAAFQVVASGGKLYAATSGGLFTAPQGGGSWTQLGGGIGENKLNVGGIESVVVYSPSSIVVAVSGAAGPGVYTTSDGGDTWKRAAGMPEGENIFYLAKGTGPLIYAAGDSGVWASTDSGASWSLASDGINTASTTFRVAVGPAPNEVWAATGSSVYKSTNGGLTWFESDGYGATALPPAQLKAAFLLAPSLQTDDVIVGTNDGVWASPDGGTTWGQMSPDTTTQIGLFGTRIIYALGVGFSPAALLAGTEGFGVYSLPLGPVVAPSSFSVSPSSGLQPGDSIDVTPAWTATLPVFYTYQWKRCQGASCSNVDSGGTESSYTIPLTDANSSDTYEVQVCAINLLTPVPVCKTSNKTTGGVAATPTDIAYPLHGINDSSLSPNPSQSYPWGTTFTINPGDWATAGDPSTPITPAAFYYQWERCDNSNVCTAVPGATLASYTTTAADVGDTIVGYVQAAHYLFGSQETSQQYEAGETFTIIEKTPVNTQAPKIVGTPYVGTTLDSTAGAWDAHDPTFSREWLECNADGLDCNPLNPDQTARNYTITSADLGSRLELQITATQADPSQNRVTVATSAPTAVITTPPSGTPPPPPKPKPKPPLPAPTLGKLKFGHQGKLATVVFNVTGSGSVILALQRITTGHRVHGRCVNGKRKHARGCSFYSTKYTIHRKAAKSGRMTITLSTKVHGHLLPPGRYRVLVTPVSASGKHGTARSLNLVLRRAK